MDIRFLREACAVLKEEPLYTPKVLRFNKEREIAIIMRGGNLFAFSSRNIKVEGNFIRRREDNSVFVSTIVFQVEKDTSESIEGEVFLDPRLKQDGEIIEILKDRRELSLVFFSNDFCQAVSKKWLFPSYVNEGIQETIAKFEGQGFKSLDNPDKDFETAKESFQQQRSIKDLLDNKA
jgi:hypothetical protein